MSKHKKEKLEPESWTREPNRFMPVVVTVFALLLVALFAVRGQNEAATGFFGIVAGYWLRAKVG